MNYPISILARRKPRDQSGLVMILMTMLLLVMLAAMTLSVDAGYWFFERARTQTAVDAAAFAGAIAAAYAAQAALDAGKVQQEAEKEAKDEAREEAEYLLGQYSGRFSIINIEVVVNVGTGGAVDTALVSLEIETPAERFFSGLTKLGGFDIAATAEGVSPR